jgi:uncharacterized protein (DUF2147 family)
MFLRITQNHERGILKGLALVIVFSLAASVTASSAENGDDILGLWYNEEHDGLIEVFKCEKKYCGRIVWSKEPNYPAEDKKGRAGEPRIDDNNPDPDLRDRPIIGLQIMTGFVYSAEDQQWKQGTVYDPKNGKSYSGRITLVSPDKLYLRGYVLLPLLGRSTTWTRQPRR